MIGIVHATIPNITDLRTRMTAIIDAKRDVERQLTGDIDPRLVAVLRAAQDKLDAADQAVVFAVCALASGDKARARHRLNVATRELEEASWRLAQAEDGSWESDE